MNTDRYELRAADGTRLLVHQWSPTGKPRATVVIVHGLVEHGARYARLAAALVGAGYSVCALDLRGHGRTATSIDAIGHLADNDGWSLVVDDLALLIAHVRSQNPQLPVILLGHSMGSLLVRSYLLDRGYSVDAVVLSGPPGDIGSLAAVGLKMAQAERLLRGPNHRSGTLDRLVFSGQGAGIENARTPFDWLSRDPDEVDAYIADPRCGGIATTALYCDMFGAMRAVNDPRELVRIPDALPFLLLAGDADPLTGRGGGPRSVLAQLREAGVEDVTLRLYPEARHEVFNDTNRSEVTADLLEWLEVRMPPRPL